MVPTPFLEKSPKISKTILKATRRHYMTLCESFEKKNIKCKYMETFLVKKVCSNDIKWSNLARKIQSKIRRKTAFFGKSGGSAAVSSQFLFAPLKSYRKISVQ